ncbi:MAG: hypothetical protein U0W24_10675 [Bacteroidales bacterium]
MTEKIYCPFCSKVAYVEVPGKFECQECNTKFIVNNKDDVKIVKQGNLKILTILINLLLLPVGSALVIIFATKSSDFFSTTSLKILSFLMIGHPILMAPRELWLNSRYNDPILLELYFASLRGQLNRYGSIQKMYFYSSLVVFCVGLIFLLMSFL